MPIGRGPEYLTDALPACQHLKVNVDQGTMVSCKKTAINKQMDHAEEEQSTLILE